MKIRKAGIEDLKMLSVLFDQYRIFYRNPSDVNGAEIFLKERLQKNESVIYLAITGGELVGFTQLYPQFSSTRMKRSWLLNDLYIIPAYRGKGISKKLIDAAKQLAKESHAAGLLLETEKTNTIGNRLYPSAGFAPYDTTNFYWWDCSEF